MRHHRIRNSTALGLALAAFAAPTAGAVTPAQDLRSPDTRDAAALASSTATGQDLRSPDTRDAAALASSTATAQDLRSPDSRDAAAGRGTFSAPEVTVVKLAQSSPSPDRGIDWGDAGIGAGSLLGVIFLGFASTVAVSHRRRKGPAHPQTAVTG